jgi:hypothetical protein
MGNAILMASTIFSLVLGVGKLTHRSGDIDGFTMQGFAWTELRSENAIAAVRLQCTCSKNQSISSQSAEYTEFLFGIF